MRYFALLGVLLPLLAAVPSPVEAQRPQDPAQTQEQALPDEKLRVFLELYLSRSRVQEEFNQRLAALPNKTDAAQQRIREERALEIRRLHEDSGMGEEEYDSIQFVIASDAAARQRFDAARARAEQP